MMMLLLFIQVQKHQKNDHPATIQFRTSPGSYFSFFSEALNNLHRIDLFVN